MPEYHILIYKLSIALFNYYKHYTGIRRKVM